MRAISFLLLGVAVFVAGCVEGPPEPLPAADAPSTAAAPAEGSLDEAREPAAGIAEPSLPAATEPAGPSQPTTADPASASVAEPARPLRADDQWATEADLGGSRAEAAPGMGSKGHGYGANVVTYPIATYFQMRERIALDHIAKAMQLYQALNGRYPRTQDEFRNEIIKANAITLPVLPDGHKFYYDPEQHELVVVKPRA